MRPRTFISYGRFALILSLGFLGLGGYSHSAFAQNAPERREGDTTINLLGIQDQFEHIAARVSPSVVAVSASEVGGSPNEFPAANQLTPEKLHAELNRGVRTVGTGFVIDPRGYILTNDHVVGDGQEFWITTDAGRVYPAMVIATDHLSDLAILKTPAQLPAVRFAAGESLHRGMWSIALGNPYGLATDGNMAIAAGVISAVDRNLPKLSRDEHRLYSGLIQTTAEINPGNSGGPLVDIYSNVIGINVAVILPDKQTNGIGFAIPADAQTLRIVEQLKEGRAITHAFFGINLVTPSPLDCRVAGAPSDAGAEIDKIFPGSPAAGSSLADGDIVASFDGEAVHDTQQLARLIGDAALDRPTRLMVFRKGQIIPVSVRAIARTEVAEHSPSQRLNWNGMLLAPLPANWAQAGVIVLALDSNSPAAQQGIRQGSIITSVAGKLISNLEQLRQIVRIAPSQQYPLQSIEGTERVAASK
jgi:serine protease Do